MTEYYQVISYRKRLPFDVQVHDLHRDPRAGYAWIIERIKKGFGVPHCPDQEIRLTQEYLRSQSNGTSTPSDKPIGEFNIDTLKSEDEIASRHDHGDFKRYYRVVPTTLLDWF